MITPVPVPLGVDDHDPLTIAADKAVDLRGFRSMSGGLKSLDPRVVLGVANDLDDGSNGTNPTTFLQTWFGTATDRLMAIRSGMVKTWDGSSWSANLSASNPAPVGTNKFYSAINTLSKAYWSAGGKIQEYDGTTIADLAHDLANTFGALTLLAFANRIIAVRTYENSTEKPVRIRWCANGQPTLWATSNDGAGMLDVQETSMSPLTGGFVLGERCYLTKQREIMELQFLGLNDPTTSRVFRVESRVAGTGCVARHSIAVAEDFVLFIGPDNVYAFDGSTLKPVGEPIKRTLFNAMLNVGQGVTETAFNLVQAVVNTSTSEYCILPTNPPSQVFIYDYRRDRWYTDTRTPVARSLGIVRIGSASPSVFQSDTLIGYVRTSAGSDDAFYLDSLADTVADGYGNRTTRLETRDFFAQRQVGGEATLATDEMACLEELNFHTTPGRGSISVGISVNQGKTISITGMVADFEGYILRRKNGNFLQSGLRQGMSVTVSGADVAANNGSKTIDYVTPDEIHFTTPFDTNQQNDTNVSISSDGWITQTGITADDAGVARSFWTQSYSQVRARIGTDDSSQFEVKGVIGIRWREAGPALPP